MEIEEIKRAGKKIKKRLKFLPAVLFIILVLICLLFWRDKKIQKNEIKELKEKIEEMEQNHIKVDTIREELNKISKYSAYELNYTSVIKVSDKNKFMGLDIPLTGNFFIATVDGKMNIGINAENLEISTSTDKKGNITQVALSVPHSEILDNYTIQESLEIYDERNNFFNPIKVTDYNELIVEAEEKEKQKVLNSDVLKNSDETVKNLLTCHLQAMFGDDVKIKYGYLESSSAVSGSDADN